ncbi:MAG: phosphatidate cytidylyltransferase [Rhodospirillaceae bacterium]|nr:phosphatidate cytidylyltransferase [Rhodospirillaceae bacterium]
MAAIVDMAQPADRRALRKRILSAAVMLPLVVFDLWLGAPYWDALVCLFGMVMAWEWAAMCAVADRPARGLVLGVGPAGVLSIASVAAAVLLAATDRYLAAILVLAAGAALTTFVGMRIQGGRGRWHGFGTIYIGLPSIAVMWIRAQPENGLATVLWMVALVIAVDTGAFVFGRSIGGPKLAPRISPNKTWAGLIGGVVAGMLVGFVTALWLGVAWAVPLVLVSAVMAVVEQGGDLGESACKRYFGVKDSSRLIPGHGGVLDRVDGLLAVALAVAIAELIGGGILAWTR